MSAPRRALAHMLAFLEELARHGPESRSALEEDIVRARFALHTLALLGEAARRLPAPYKDAHPHVPWRRVIAFRNVLVHDYERVDPDEVWRILAEDVPHLRAQLAELHARAIAEPESGDGASGG